jgi:hypothetical protein
MSSSHGRCPSRAAATSRRFPSGQHRVAAAVIEVQVAVDDHPDVAGREAGLAEGAR